MFRLEYLKIENHPQLGNIELLFSEENEIVHNSKPYTSVIIGPNGTGKSYILKTIAEIFRQFQTYSLTDRKEFSFPFDIHIRYNLHFNVYEIVTRKLKAISNRTGRVNREYLYYKNRPHTVKLFNSSNVTEIITGYEIDLKELKFPEKLIVNSVMLTDRFVWKNSNPMDFYQYLGVRSTKTTSSTQSASRKTIKYLLSAIATNTNFIENLKELLNFLGFEESFQVHYSTKVSKLFFSGSLSIDNFKKYYEYWWDENFIFSKRKKENPLWSIPYYNRNFKDNYEKTVQVVNFINDLSSRRNILLHKKNSTSKTLPLDLLGNKLDVHELEMIGHLESLDIISLDGIKIRKSKSTLSINDISSGEYHLLISLIGMFSNISNNSLILIDEPEISLHPNWQMRYISFLKDVFSRFNNSHFILTTHSHFLISDLEGESSKIIGLKNEDGKINIVDLPVNIDTYGWSAEDILYNIFNVRSSLNYYLQADLTELLGMIANNIKEVNKIETILDKLNKLPKRDNDPLQEIIHEASEYLNSIR